MLFYYSLMDVGEPALGYAARNVALPSSLLFERCPAT